MKTLPSFLTVMTVSMFAVLLQPVAGQPPQVPLRMRAFAVNMTNVATGANAVLEITIESVVHGGRTRSS